MKKLKLFIAGLVLLALALVPVLLVLSLSRQPATAWTLPDGSKMRLVKVTYGTNNTCVAGNRLLDLIYPYVPAKFRTNFNFQVATALSGRTPSLMLWLERTGVPANSITPTTPAARLATSSGISIISGALPYRFNVFDGHGLETRVTVPRRYGFASNTSELVAVTLSQYPAQARTLGIHLYTSTANTSPLAEFHLPNRAPPPQYPPGWVPEPLPATRQTNGLEVTLEKVETGLPTTTGAVTSHGLKSNSRLTFTVKEAGQTSSGWAVKRISTSNAPDRTNTLIYGGSTSSHGTITITSPLWLDDPAWKIRMELAREQDFPANEIWTLEGLPVPKDGETLELNLTTNLFGGKVTLTSVSDAPNGALFGSTGTLVASTTVGGGTFYSSPSAPPRLSLSFQLDGSVSVAVISVKDDQGQALKYSGGGTSSSSLTGISRRSFTFNRSEGAKTLTATVGISRSVAVEFMVKPVLAGN